ncbi:hypothetical protein PsorP6_013778 [Peronosclerospora sorghi]|uniref:Uncharacterized protein n=1 Tax=Peronosclerospora sorghi TaxID=230839 RepID=A0ACC0VFQ3_9STRA|nr:hypothetical protein PsorP6_013778 [Peronosclerospora sorghi]
MLFRKCNRNNVALKIAVTLKHGYSLSMEPLSIRITQDLSHRSSVSLHHLRNRSSSSSSLSVSACSTCSTVSTYPAPHTSQHGDQFFEDYEVT